MSDPQFNSVTANSLESVGKGKRTIGLKGHKSSVTYPQKRITGTEKKINADPSTSPKNITKKSGAKKYVNVKPTVRK
jgi:hypothetical protein